MPMNKVPTLLVGLGGIGCAIADIAGAMLNDELKEYVGVIGLDTNVEDLKKLKIKHIRTSDEKLVKDYIIEHPEYRKWFPVNKFTVNRGMMTGAGQIRAISRMAALASIEAGRFIVLDEEIKRILKHTGDKDNTAFNVFIVGSITGGTGAGLFLQMPFYIRRLLKNEYAIGNVRIRGMFVSADITKNVQSSKINREAVMVNAYACMKELNAFYLTQVIEDSENRLSMEYYEKTNRRKRKDDIKERMIKSKVEEEFGMDFFSEIDDEVDRDIEDIASEGDNIPYNAFYLIEGTDNEGGIGNASIDSVNGQIAKMIYTILFTPVKGAADGTEDNMVLKDIKNGGMNRYSSAGMCSLKYPHEQAKEYVTLSWVRDLVKQEWLLLDKQYESEKREAQDRQKTDPSVILPKIEEAYVRLFDKETRGGEGCRLGSLRHDAYIDTQNKENREVCKSAMILRRIEGEIDRIMSQDVIATAEKECKVNMKKISDLDVADSEISRVYNELESLREVISGTIDKSRYEIANEVFPISMESLKMKQDSPLCIYGQLANIHPVAARFLCYNLLNQIDLKIRELETALSGIDLMEYENVDFYGTMDDGIQDASEAVALIRNDRIPFIKSGKKPLRILVSKFQQMASAQVQALDEYGRSSLKLSTYKLLRERLAKMNEYYAEFFNEIETQMNNNEVRIELLEKSFQKNPYGEINVYASPEAFREMYQDFKAKAEFELPEDTKKAIFNGVFSVVCRSLEDKNKELSELQKQKQEEAIRIRLYNLFADGITDTLRTIVVTKGNSIVDLTIKEAIEKEMRMKDVDPDIDTEKKRIAYARALIERAMRVAAPMFAVRDEQDLTETIYMTIHPDAAELKAGTPDRGATQETLIPEICAATDNQPVNVLMEPEFSKYEIVCFKSKHKYCIENLVKYQSDSDYAKVYEERISNLGKEPSVEGQDAYKTVVNPHLNRYWHEEGFVPQMGAKERQRAKQDAMKAFIYAMGMDTFGRFPAEELDNRVLWYLVDGSRSYPVRKEGKLIGNGYVDLYDSLSFNGKVKKYILRRAEIMMESIKGFLDADEMMDTIQDTWFIEDLVQSKSDGEEDMNILDIFLEMYPNMDKEKWAKLFEGLKLVIFEFAAYMFDENRQRVNEAYKMILKRMYGYSRAGKKEIERRRIAGEGTAVPAELEFTFAEKKLQAHIADLIKEKYI